MAHSQQQQRQPHEPQQRGTHLYSWTRETLVPCMWTLCTPEVETSCKTNHLSFTQLLQPFCRLTQKAVPVRTPLRTRSHTLTDFGFRLIPAAEVGALSLLEIEAQLDAALHNTQPLESVSDLINKAPTSTTDLGEFVKDIARNEEGDSMPWCTVYRETLVQSLRHQHHHMLDHPVASILATSTQSPDPIVCLEDLSNPRNMPAAFVTGQYDVGSVPKIYVLVHDRQIVSPGHDPTAMLARMRKRFHGDLCFLITINSLPADNPGMLVLEPWVNVTLERDVVGVPGRYLSTEDVSALKGLAAEIALRGVEFLERRILAISTQVRDRRQGIRNTFKSWLRRPTRQTKSTAASVFGFGSSSSSASANERSNTPSKLTTPDSILTGSTPYSYDAMESQIRLLADLAFMIRDYDYALEMYRLVRDDYKSDKALMHLGSVKEMMALAVFMRQYDSSSSSASTDISSSHSSVGAVSSMMSSSSQQQRLQQLHTSAAGGVRERTNSNDSNRSVTSNISTTTASSASIPPRTSASNVRTMAAYLEDAYAAYNEAAKTHRTNARMQAQSAGADGSSGDMNTGANVADKCATACALLYLEIMRSSSSLPNKLVIHDVSNFLLKASTEESSASAALLLEQAGSCLIAQDWTGVKLTLIKPMLRKCAFQLVMAGWLYNRCGMKAHAARCYGSIMGIYKQKGWRHVDYHMGLNLGKWMVELGLSSCAVELWIETLGMNGGTLGREKQGALLELVRDTLAQVSAVEEVVEKEHIGKNIVLSGSQELQLPVVHDIAIRTFTRDNALMKLPDVIPWPLMDNNSYNNNSETSTSTSIALLATSAAPFRDAHAQNDMLAESQHDLLLTGPNGPTWVGMKKQLDNVATRISGEGMKYIPKRRGKPPQAPRKCFVNEPFYVEIPLSNPLDFELTLENVGLVATMIDGNEKRSTEQEDSFSLEHIATVTLRSLERRVIRLSVLPLIPGKLQVTGVQWTAFGGIHNTHTFTLIGPKLSNTKSQRARGERDVDMRLHADVGPVRPPWVGLRLVPEPPSQLRAGQVFKTNLELANLGVDECNEGSMLVCANRPGVVVTNVGEKSSCVDDAGLVSTLRIDNLGSQVMCTGYMSGGTGSIGCNGHVGGVVVGNEANVRDGNVKVVSVPVWLRLASHKGEMKSKEEEEELRLMVRYTSKDGAVKRYARYCSRVTVRPQVRVNVLCFPSSSSSLGEQEYILNVVMENVSESLSNIGYGTTSGSNFSCVSVKRVLCLSPYWKVSNVRQVGESLLRNVNDIPAGASAAVTIKLIRRTNNVSDINTNVNIGVVEWCGQQGNLRLATGSNEIVGNETTLSLLGLTHAQAVLHQREHAQGSFEYAKSVLESQGKLPVSIQEVRRANNAEDGSSDDVNNIGDPLAGLDNGQPRPNEPRACSQDALFWTGRTRDSELHVVVEWEATSSNSNPTAGSIPTGSISTGSSEVVVGHSHTVNVRVRPPLEACPLSLSASYTPVVSLFAQAAMTTVPVQVCVTNVSNATMSFVLDAKKKNKKNSVVTANNGFSWFGLTRKVVLSLGPGESAHVDLTSAFFRAGVFDLNTFEAIEVVMDNESSTCQTSQKVHSFSSQLLIHVTNEAGVSTHITTASFPAQPTNATRMTSDDDASTRQPTNVTSSADGISSVGAVDDVELQEPSVVEEAVNDFNTEGVVFASDQLDVNDTPHLFANHRPVANQANVVHTQIDTLVEFEVIDTDVAHNVAMFDMADTANDVFDIVDTDASAVDGSTATDASDTFDITGTDAAAAIPVVGGVIDTPVDAATLFDNDSIGMGDEPLAGAVDVSDIAANGSNVRQGAKNAEIDGDEDLGTEEHIIDTTDGGAMADDDAGEVDIDDDNDDESNDGDDDINADSFLASLEEDEGDGDNSDADSFLASLERELGDDADADASDSDA